MCVCEFLDVIGLLLDRLDMVYIADLYTQPRARADINGQVLDPKVCVCGCLCVRGWYTELTCIPKL